MGLSPISDSAPEDQDFAAPWPSLFLKANRDDDLMVPNADVSSKSTWAGSIIHLAKGDQFDNGKKKRPFEMKGYCPFTNCTVLKIAVAD